MEPQMQHQQHQQQQQHHPHQPQKLPAGLAGVLNSPEENRDSAYYSINDVSSSKHTSAASCVGINVLNSAPHGFASPADKTPSPTAASLVPPAMASPSSNMSVASMVSPTTPGGADPRLLEPPQSLDATPNSADRPRRESVDSRFNQGFGEMRLGNSPYASHNQSTTSIQNSLQQQRNPRPSADSLSVHRISNGYQPRSDRNPEGHPKVVRTAPAITGPATGAVARAAEPTKGQAWAFPEEEIQRVPPAASQSATDSRRSSITESIASSQFTTESRLPPGQRRLDDVSPDFNRLSSNSGEFPAVHHHSLQHKQLGDLRSEESGSHAGSQPYSRTPELRISHKLAERKRRTEMKELFEQLRDLMPQERGSKASKWEILTKAISEHQRQNDAIRQWQSHCSKQQVEIDLMTRELSALRVENSQLRQEVAHGPSNQASANHSMPAQPAPSSAEPYTPDAYARPPRPELPPLRSLGGGVPSGPESMTGVQYEGPRTNGFRSGHF